MEGFAVVYARSVAERFRSNSKGIARVSLAQLH